MTEFENPEGFGRETHEKAINDSKENSMDNFELKKKRKVEQLRRIEKEYNYQDRLLLGDVGQKEAIQKKSDSLKKINDNPKLLGQISPDLIEFTSRITKKSKNEKEKSGTFPAKYEAELDRLQKSKKEEFFLITTNLKSTNNNLEFQNFNKELQQLMPNYILLDKKQQLAIAESLKEKWNFSGDAELLRKIMVMNAKESGDIEQMKIFVRDPNTMKVYEKLIEEGSDSAKAFEEALKQGSPELQKSFNDYFRQWQSPGVADVFPPNPDTMAGVKVETPSNAQIRSGLKAYQQEGIKIDISPESHTGIVYIGDTIMREAAIYLVDNAPRLFIYDHNADKGIRGPIAPDKGKDLFFEISVDDYFSRKFREFSTVDSEKDPTKLGDNKLLKIVHAFFSLAALQNVKLDINSRQLLDNLAYLTVANDDHYVSIMDKVQFFDRIINDPLKSWAAKNLLSKKDFTKKGYSLRIFEQELEESLKK
jgi:hypothetical protein